MQASTLPPSRDLEAQTTSLPLRYLGDVSKKRLQELQTKYNKTSIELDAIIEKRRIKFMGYKRFYQTCALSIGTMAYLQVQLSSTGVNTLTNLMFGTNVSDTVGYGIGIPAAILGIIPLFFVFSPTTKAIEKILASELLPVCPPCLSPKKTASSVAKFLIKKIVLVPTNLTGAMNGSIGLAKELSRLSPVSRGISIATITAFQFEYYNLLYNDDFSNGLKFLRNKKYPWLYQFDNVATAFQIAIQGAVSSVGLRAFPIYFFLAQQTEALLGRWFPALFIVITTTMQGLGSLYITTYLRYTKTDIKIDDLLYERLAPIIREFIHRHRERLGLTTPLSPAILEKQVRMIVKTERSLLETEQKPVQTWKHVLKKEPAVALFIGYRAFIGGNIGFEIAPFIIGLIDAPLVVTIACTLGGALLFGELLRLADMKRIRDDMSYKYLQKQCAESKNPVSQEITALKKTRYEKIIDHTGTLLTIASVTLGVTSTIGATTKILPATAPNFVSKIIALFAVERGINSYFFQKEKQQKLVRTLWEKNHDRVTPVAGTLFHAPEQKGVEEKPYSWLCCRRRKR